MRCQNDPDELARSRMRVAFECCDRAVCCPAATWHRPHCVRRAERLAQDFTRPDKGLDPDLTRTKRWEPKMEAVSEIGGRRGCVWMFVVTTLTIALTMGLSWWVVYG